ncbi:MAG: lipoyl(octanoyl) transferase LipB [Bacteroidota bacterium]
MNKKTEFIHLGLEDYQSAWDFQERLFKETVDQKIANRKLPPTQQVETKNYLIFCEHPHVYTLGKSGDANHLLANEAFLKQIHATFYRINRGGDITYHGPGQLVGYPILDLDHFFTDIHRYLRFLEEAVIQTLQEYNVKAGRVDGLTGVWIDGENPEKARKICALGVKSSRWVTMHGFAFNVNTDLSYFNHIVPCGIQDRAVTSLSKELGMPVEMKEVEEQMKVNLAAIFEMELVD